MTDNVKPFPPLLPGEFIKVDAEEAKRINDHCQALHDEIIRLRGEQAE